jgi:Uma2 family endonuclease
VVEVLSPGNNVKEFRIKMGLYEQAGVKEYWIASPQDEWLKIFTLINGKFVESPFLLAGDTLRTTVLRGFKMDMAALFATLHPDEVAPVKKKKR